MVQPWLRLLCSCERRAPHPIHMGPSEGQAKVLGGLLPWDLTCLEEVGVKSVHCLNACFLCFPFTKGF